jgi:hypothetical protein
LSQIHDDADKEEYDAMREDPVALDKAAKFAYTSSIVLTVVLLLVWPIPMYFSRYVFSPAFFTGWVVLGITWTLISAGKSKSNHSNCDFLPDS